MGIKATESAGFQMESGEAEKSKRQHSLLGEHLKHAGLMPAHLTAQRPKESFQALTDPE